MPITTAVHRPALRRLAALSVAVVCACAGSASDHPPSDSASRAPAAGPQASSVVIDSANVAALARLRTRIGPAPAHLAGFRSRDSLVAAFAHAVDARDSTALRSLALSVEEFAYLYYPYAPLALPPYGLDPETMWLQIGAESGRGASRTLVRYGGKLGFVSYGCEPEPRVSGPVTLWNRCAVTHRGPAGPLTEPLFGSIIERDGWYKFVGLSNHL